MRSISLGSQGLVVSAQGLGCMGMSDFYGIPNPNAEEASATIHRALELGVTLFDTADSYANGANEALVGRALGRHRAGVVIATKVGLVRASDHPRTPPVVNGTPGYLRAACEASLRRLRTDYIDLYYQHRLDPGVPVEETVGALAGLVAEGKVRFIGLSEVSPDALRRGNSVHPISALQTEYSLWSRDPEAELLPLARDLHIGFVAYSPLGRGFLTGRIHSLTQLDDGDGRRLSSRFQGINFNHNVGLLVHLEEVARSRALSPAQVALAWLHARPWNVVPLPGTRRRVRLEENLAAERILLRPDEMSRLEAAFRPDAAAGERIPRPKPNGRKRTL